MTSKLAILAFATVTVVSPWATMQALADTDLEGNIQAIECPTEEDAGHISVLGVTSVLPFGTIIKSGPNQITCDDLSAGERVKVKCADPACDTVASLHWKGNVSAEGPVAAADCEERSAFQLASGVVCDVDGDTSVKLKKPKAPKPPKGLPHVHPTPATLDDLFDLLCDEGTVLGTTAGTVEVKCEGQDAGEGHIDASKVHSKH